MLHIQAFTYLYAPVFPQHKGRHSLLHFFHSSTLNLFQNSILSTKLTNKHNVQGNMHAFNSLYNFIKSTC